MDNMLVNLKFISFPEMCLHIGGFGSRLKLKVLYGFAGGFYSYSIFALIFWETRRSDFGVSMSHHIASVFLIVFSYLARFFFPLCDLLLATFHYIRTMPFL